MGFKSSPVPVNNRKVLVVAVLEVNTSINWKEDLKFRWHLRIPQCHALEMEEQSIPGKRSKQDIHCS